MAPRSIIISDFETVLPANRVPQNTVNRWSLERHLDSARLDPGLSAEDVTRLERIWDRYAVGPELIAFRHLECTDLGLEDLTQARVYKVNERQLSGSGIADRTRFFAERAEAVLEDFYLDPGADLSHIVHVTCTGYRSPSAAQRLVAAKGWGATVGVTHAYHMGCYASLPAIRIAEGLVRARNFDAAGGGAARVDVVHTEMCGLHMNTGDHTPEQIVVQTLFADGHVKYTVSEEGTSASARPALRLLAIKEQVIAGSDADMSWTPDAWGLRMTLSREVPGKLRGVIDEFFGALAVQAGQDASELRRSALFAVHPGGPKIIRSVQDALRLSDAQVAESDRVLRERGNMSSATLPHVWKGMLDAAPAPGTRIVSFAFGPGLTVFGAVFEVV